MLVDTISIVPVVETENGNEIYQIPFPSNASLYGEVIPRIRTLERKYSSVEIWAVNQDGMKIRKLWDQSCSMKESETRFIRFSLSGIWVEIHPKMLVYGDVIKMFEPDGTPVCLFSTNEEPCYVAVVKNVNVDWSGQCILTLE
jgi:hypothetical protein